nr:hypothetical protein [Tanacetum cinerariifolium]GEY92474.1 hypothetical protein [Tanacetum cinerariifolium]
SERVEEASTNDEITNAKEENMYSWGRVLNKMKIQMKRQGRF